MIIDVTNFATGITLSGSVPIFATILGIILATGGAAGYFKASRGDSIIKYQATELGLRDTKIAGLEKDLAACNESCTAKDQTITELKKHNAYLQKLAQGAPRLKKIEDKLDKLITKRSA